MTYELVKNLTFDRQNIRFRHFLSGEITDGEIGKLLWNTGNLKNLVHSIVMGGYFEAPLIAERGSPAVVLDGNRRLAAVKALLDKPSWLPNQYHRDDLDRVLPVVYKTRKQAWRQILTVHFENNNWTLFQRANYVKDLVDSMNVTLEQIGNQLGGHSKTNIVKSLYTTIKLMDFAEDHCFDFSDTYYENFNFGLLHTAIRTGSVQGFLYDVGDGGLRNIQNLRLLLLWLYGSKDSDQKPIVLNPDDLETLLTILESESRTKILVTTSSLKIASGVK